MVKLKYSLLSVALYAVFWGIWFGLLRFCTIPALKLSWIGVIALLPIGFCICVCMDRVQIAIDIFIGAKALPSLAPMYWALLPSLTFGAWVISMPIRLGIIASSLYGLDVSAKDWVVLAELTAFPLLNLISILRTPGKVRLTQNLNNN